MSKVRLPQPDNRTAIVGSSGSGKTQFAVALLSSRNFDVRPWVIFDFKGDELIEQIGATEVSINKPPPTKPGLYVVRPLPGSDAAVEEYFKLIWMSGWTGIYIDEGYMVPKGSKYFRACLTQGRSKRIEMIILSQRPRWMDTFVFTEANFFAVFNINFKEDRKHMSAYLGDADIDLLPDYHCIWYDVNKQKEAILKPVPEASEIIATFAERLSTKRELKRI